MRAPAVSPPPSLDTADSSKARAPSVSTIRRAHAPSRSPPCRARRYTRRTLMARTSPPEDLGWGHSTVRTACPLDCPDSCTLEVTVEKGRVVKIDGGDANAVTRNYICGKVRRFAERMYGEDRLLYPAIRTGAKGAGTFVRVTWDEALDQIARRMEAIRDTVGRGSDPAVLLWGIERTADAGHQRRGAVPRIRHVAAGAHGLRRADRGRQPGLYGKMPGVTYEDYVHARLIVLWGVNPAASGIHLVPFIKDARKRGAPAGRHRSARDLAGAAGRSPPRAPARHRSAARARAAPRSVPARRADTEFLAGTCPRRRRAPRQGRRVDDRARRAHLRDRSWRSRPASRSFTPPRRRH